MRLGLARSAAARAQAMAIRDEVFVREQGVPVALERDEIDAVAVHLLAVLDGVAVGTARAFARPEAPATAGIGRVAVRAAARGQGIATAMMRRLLTWCRRRGFARVSVHAQLYIAPFYAGFGFRPCGPPFREAGIEHVEMVLALGGRPR